MAFLLVAIAMTAFVYLVMKYLDDFNFSKEFNGAGVPLPLLGHVYFLFNYKKGELPTQVPREDGLRLLSKLSKSDPDGRKLGCIFGTSRIIFYFHPDPAQEIFKSQEYINKSVEYKPMLPWLGTGLLLAPRKKWHARRKLLTPAFHFRILDDALVVFNIQGRILADVLLEDSTKNGGKPLNIFPYITRCTLDVILETAMGVQMGTQQARISEYCDTINNMVHVCQQKQILPWLQNEFLFQASSYKKPYDKALHALHKFTRTVIYERRKKYQVGSQQNAENTTKGRVSFLDILISATLPDGSKLKDSDIQEEVDTFMFEGHDTTACGLSWLLYLLGKHPEIMAKVVQEQKDVFKDDYDQDVTMEHLSKMKYLECCVKEGLRLYPSVPIVGRDIKRDTIIDGQHVPKGTSVLIVLHLLHRNPQIWDKPEEFIPERFLDSRSNNRHPYAYVPFSAGPRNCIGQRFALMEEKTILSHVLRRLDFKSTDKHVKPIIELITRPFNGINSIISSRIIAENNNAFL